MNRDPIEENGGLNLYGFVGNEGVNQWDYLGNFSGGGIGSPPLPGYTSLPPPNSSFTADVIDATILDKPIQKKLFSHYRFGNETKLPMTVDEYFSTLPDAQNLTLFSIPSLPTEQGNHKIEKQSFQLSSRLTATLNTHTVYLDGHLCIDNQGLSFDGTIKIIDKYNFDWKKFGKSGRSTTGEINTRLVSLTVPGTAYDIQLGPVSFKQQTPNAPMIDGKPVPSSPSGVGGN